MRRRSLIVAIVPILLVVGALAAAVFVLNQQADGKIAQGVVVGDVDVSGMTPDEARAKIHRELLEPLDRPIVVRHDGERWRLTADEAKIHADVDGMVSAAVERSEEGNVIQVAWRQATGGALDASIPAEVSYSKAAVRDLVARVQADVDRAPKDAEVTFAAASLGEVDGEQGVALEARKLRRKVKRAITDPTAKRRFRATTRTVAPEVTTDELAERYPVVITVDRANFKLRLWKSLKLDKTYDIAVGKVGMDTPEGLYSIANKAVDPAWHVPNSEWAGDLAGQVIAGDDPSNPIKSRWMGIYDGVGIHGTDADSSIGTAASHGCIRMRIPEVEELYEEVPVGAAVYIG